MSEPKLISPMLDNFAMGEPISNHHGVQCCPAMPNDSDSKYIVKIISIPASQIKLQALLLTGALPNEAAARDYFLDQANDVVAETEILAKLSKMEGFLPYENCQVVPMENEVGYDVYLLSPYKRSLSRHFRKDTITHLGMVNLGLDMCASLAVCRQAGYLYADLKPDNIFICNDKEYRIGDIGFLKLDSLKFASLPERCISVYTAPEIVDAFSDINPTIDIYAAGLILYQAYNGGVLPFEGRAPAEVLPPPAYADYEMAEIILKACAPDPKDRWQNPIAMGQAIVAYMQRNGANDTPIVAPVQDPIPEIEDDYLPEETEEVSQEQAAAEDEIDDELSLDNILDEVTDDQLCLDEFYELCGEDTEADSGEAVAVSVDLDISGLEEPEADTDLTMEPDAPESDDEDDDLLNLSFLDEMISDDTAPSEDMAIDFAYNELSDDASSILAQADDLISHETPEGVVAPEPIEIPMPEPIVLPPDPDPEDALVDDLIDDDEEDDEDDEDLSMIADAQDEEEDTEEDSVPEMTEEEEKEYIRTLKREERKKRAARRKVAKRLIAVAIVLLILAGLAFGGYVFYKEYYLRSVTSLSLSGSEDQLVVSVVADVDESALTVYCIDTSGTKLEQPVVNGKAVFTGLTPNTFYNVKVEVTGLHKLTGEIADSYTTPVQTHILSFTAVTGTEPGTAVLSFTVDGVDSDTWFVTYSAEGVEEQKQIFSGHMVNISGLVSGKTYTFKLESGSELYIAGVDELQYLARDPVFAQSLSITGCTENSLDVQWTTPEGAAVESWTVRCYSDSGYDQTVVTEQTSVTFTGLNGNEAHTVEVIASGMSAGTRCYMTANAVTVSNIAATKVNDMTLKLTWDFAGNTPEGQWIVTYNVDGSSDYTMVRTDTNSATISPLIPGGAYNITVLLEDGTTVFTEPVTIVAPEAKKFSANGLNTTNVDVRMCKTPAKANWSRTDLAPEDYTDTFTAGSKASFLLYAKHPYDPVRTEFHIMYVIHAEDGTLISNNIVKLVWRNMWSKNYCELDVPALPDTPGTYSIEVYLNGMLLHSQNFHITEG